MTFSNTVIRNVVQHSAIDTENAQRTEKGKIQKKWMGNVDINF